MQPASQKTIDAICSDEFARKTIECAKSVLYANFRDWGKIRRDGQIPWDNEQAGITYDALCVLIDDNSRPVVDGKIGELSCSSIEILEEAFS